MMEIGIEISGTVSSAAVAASYAYIDLMGSLLFFKVSTWGPIVGAINSQTFLATGTA